MTDKQIIIDGINVAGCEDYGYRRKAGYWCHNYDEPCTDYPNCYYKQLKRKEQELKNICKAFNIEYAIDEETGNLIGRCNKLYNKEQEYEELKEQYKKVEDMMIKSGANMCGELQNLYRTLDEIENYCKGCNLKFDYTACDILNIINKLKED